MGFLDDAKKKLGDAVDKHGDKISDGLDKAGNAVDEKTGGKHRDKIDTGVGKAKGALDDLDGKRDDSSATAAERRPSRARPEPSTRRARRARADRPPSRAPEPGPRQTRAEPTERRPSRPPRPGRRAGRDPRRWPRVSAARAADPGEKPEPEMDAPPDDGPGGPADMVDARRGRRPRATADQPRSAQVEEEHVPDEIEEPEDKDKDVEQGREERRRGHRRRRGLTPAARADGSA